MHATLCAFRLALVLLGTLGGCSTAASLERVRAVSPTEGISLYVHAEAPGVVQALPTLLGALHYSDLSSETGADGVAVHAAKRSSASGFGNAVRVIVAPGPVPDHALVRLTFVRRLRLNASEDLEAARDTLVEALRKRFGGP